MYIILEVQLNTNKTVGTLITNYTNRNEAESKYHQVLAAAAISSVPIHTAFMLTPEGAVIQSKSYTHEIEQTE